MVVLVVTGVVVETISGVRHLVVAVELEVQWVLLMDLCQQKGTYPWLYVPGGPSFSLIREGGDWSSGGGYQCFVWHWFLDLNLQR